MNLSDPAAVPRPFDLKAIALRRGFTTAQDLHAFIDSTICATLSLLLCSQVADAMKMQGVDATVKDIAEGAKAMTAAMPRKDRMRLLAACLKG